MNYIEEALKVVDIEAAAILKLRDQITESFHNACEKMLATAGRIVVLGLGKSGHIGSKIAATLASTGTPAFFVHAAEAAHGDMGMITQQDLVLALSHSGNTEEVLTLLPVMKRLNIPVIAITGNPQSKLATEADIVLDTGAVDEACPLGLAPTASTTATLVMGDALAVSLLVARGFQQQDFAFAHPGGYLGKKLLLDVQSLMVRGDNIPRVPSGATIQQAILVTTQKRLGMTTIVDDQDRLLGIFTDGDVRRTLETGVDIANRTIDDVMTRHPKTVNQSMLAVEALKLMNHYKITSLVVVGSDDKIIGILHIHDLLKEGL